jgi:3',5'-nucleoside bisphosphate phosphatase
MSNLAQFKGPSAGLVDLHTHSTASDGELGPAELVKLALERGLSVIALTDHDSVAGIDAALDAAQNTRLEVIPGVELSADVPQAEVHVLGYWIDWRDAHLAEMLVRFREGRFGRAEKMVQKLALLGVPITFERVRQIAGDASIGRPHVAQALVEAGHVANVTEAFDKYIGRNGPAYVERFRLTPEDAVGLILQAGGVPVLAHPREVTAYVEPMVRAGMLGLEVYYGAYDEATVQNLQHLARQYGLVATGGSDFHGLNKMAHMSNLGLVHVPPEVTDRLRRKRDQVRQERSMNKGDP